MKKNEAQWLVRSLIGRLDRKDGVWRLPDARLSPEEVTALKRLSGLDAQVPTPKSTDPEVEQSSRKDPGSTSELTAARIEIDRSALNNSGPPEDDIRLCIDFGTAMSKACATLQVDDSVVPLRLGRIAEGRDTWSVPSSLYISESGRLYFGHAAERQHRSSSSDDRRRERFDNIKYMLSEIEPNINLFDISLRKSIDPTGTMTHGDALLLYLAWLTDHACKTLVEANPTKQLPEEMKSIRYIKRRFAIPCFESASDENDRGPERAAWARQTIQETVVYAQVIADTLSDNWAELTVDRALSVIRRCRESISASDLAHLLANRPDVREPIAAGASQFSEQVELGSQIRQRRSLLVVDAGAGTTDFALFNVATAVGQDVRYSLVHSSVKMHRLAGNEVDAILREIIIEKCGIDRNFRDQDRDLAKNDLDSQVREIKQQIFDEDKARFNIRPRMDGEVRREEVEQHSKYKRLGEGLRSLRNEIIETSIQEDNRVPGQHAVLAVDVLLTGGSSALPIFQMLATGIYEIKGWQVCFREVGKEWIEYLVNKHGEEVMEQYPQLAVAIGGSVPECPEEIRETKGMILPSPPGERQVAPVYRGQ